VLSVVSARAAKLAADLARDSETQGVGPSLPQVLETWDSAAVDMSVTDTDDAVAVAMDGDPTDVISDFKEHEMAVNNSRDLQSEGAGDAVAMAIGEDAADDNKVKEVVETWESEDEEDAVMMNRHPREKKKLYFLTSFWFKRLLIA